MSAASDALPAEGAIREGFGVPVIPPWTVRWVLCNHVLVDGVVAYSIPGGWVCVLLRDSDGRVDLAPAPGRMCRTVPLRLEGRVEVAR